MVNSQIGLMFAFSIHIRSHLFIYLFVCFCRVTEEAQVLKDWPVLWVRLEPQVRLVLLETQAGEENR